MLEKYKILRSAEKHVINRNLNQAIREYERIAEQESEDPGILNTLGDLLLKDGRRDDALTRFRRVAEIYVQSGFLSKAIATCKKIHHLDPRDDETNSRLVELFSRQGLNSEAVHHLEGLVKQCQTWGQLDSALAYQEQILTLVSDRPDDHLTAARLLHQLERMEDAQNYYQKAVRLFRNQGAVNLGYEAAREALRLCGESPRAIKDFVEIAEDLAIQLREEGRIEEAERCEQEVLDLKGQEEIVVEPVLTDEEGALESGPVPDTSPAEEMIIASTPDVRGFDLLVDQPNASEQTEEEDESDSRPGFAEYLFGSNSESEQIGRSESEDPESSETFSFDDSMLAFDESVSGRSDPAAGEPVLQTVPEVAREGENAEQEVAVSPSEREETWDGSLDEALQEADFYLKLGLKDDARSLIEKLVRFFPADERVRQRAIKASVQIPEELVAPTEVAEVPEASDFNDDFGIEVESALDDLFSNEVEPEPEEVLRYDVTSTSGNSKDDPRVHYDLGMAYKEMGLLEDAVEKFQDAYQLFNGQNSAPQRILCCSMLSTAYNQLKNFEQAVMWSEEGLSLPDKKDYEWKALQYDRCYALEEMGEIDRALEGYATILDRDPGYRDVSQKVEALTIQVNGQ